VVHDLEITTKGKLPDAHVGKPYRAEEDIEGNFKRLVWKISPDCVCKYSRLEQDEGKFYLVSDKIPPSAADNPEFWFGVIDENGGSFYRRFSLEVKKP